MAPDWRVELQSDRRVVELRSLMWAKWRSLGRDKEFVRETSRLKSRLDRAFNIEPESVEKFFQSYSFPAGTRLAKLKKYLQGVKLEAVRDVLRLYVRYVARFGVVMYFRKRKPHFRTSALVPWGTKFHATLSGKHLRPTKDSGGSAYIYSFEDDNVKTPAALEKLVQAGGAKFVQIDDEEGSSVLTEIEAFGYYPDGLTFILHDAEQPYIMCLIGEKASSKTWRDAERAVHALQRECYGRVNSGKPADIRQMLKVSAALRKSGSSKIKALRLGKTENAWSSQSAFSRLKSKLT